MLGVLGNLATCIVILRNEYMRTTTNIYLFNLAVADLLTLLFAMPIELYLMWRQYPWTLGEVCIIQITVIVKRNKEIPSASVFLYFFLFRKRSNLCL